MMSFDKLKERLGQELLQERMRRHWSQADLASEIKKLGGDVGQKTISNIEAGGSNYEFGNLYWVCRVLGMTVGEALAFTIGDETPESAHANLARILRRSDRDADHIKRILDFTVGN